MEADSALYSTSVIESNFSHYFIFGCAIFSIAWGLYNSSQVSSPPITSYSRRPLSDQKLTRYLKISYICIGQQNSI
jgi:hypothetical protein